MVKIQPSTLKGEVILLTIPVMPFPSFGYDFLMEFQCFTYAFPKHSYAFPMFTRMSEQIPPIVSVGRAQCTVQGHASVYAEVSDMFVGDFDFPDIANSTPHVLP